MLITPSSNTTIDSFLSLVMMSYATKDTTISHIEHPDAKKAIEDISEPCTILGTTENTYNPSFNTEACFMRIAELYGISLPKDSFWKYFSDLSTKGAEKAYELNDISLASTELIYSLVEPMLKTWDLVISQGVVDTDMFLTIGKYLSKRDFTLQVLHLTAISSIVQNTYPDEFEEALKPLAKEKQKSTANEVLFEDERLLITVQDVVIADIPQALLTRSYYGGDGMEMLPMVQVLNKATGKVLECPLEGQ